MARKEESSELKVLNQKIMNLYDDLEVCKDEKNQLQLKLDLNEKVIRT